MTNHVAGLAAGLVLLTGTASSLRAQTIYGNVTTPPVSPYINILRGGASPGINYSTIVQPQIQFYNALNRPQFGNAGIGPYNQPIDSSQLLNTGHPVQFGNYLHYYTLGGINTGYGGRSYQSGQGIGQQGASGFGQGGQSGLGQGMRNLGQPPPNPRTR